MIVRCTHSLNPESGWWRTKLCSCNLDTCRNTGRCKISPTNMVCTKHHTCRTFCDCPFLRWVSLAFLPSERFFFSIVVPGFVDLATLLKALDSNRSNVGMAVHIIYLFFLSDLQRYKICWRKTTESTAQ